MTTAAGTPQTVIQKLAIVFIAENADETVAPEDGATACSSNSKTYSS